MKKYQCLLVILLFLAVICTPSCKSTPPPAATPPVEADPNTQPPGQAALNELEAAMAKAAATRESAVVVQGAVYFPDEWAKAESDNETGKKAKKDTVAAVRQAIASFTSATEGYKAIAEKSGPLFTKDLEDARTAMNEAKSRMEKSRTEASDNKGDTFFPAEWSAAEGLRQDGERAYSSVEWRTAAVSRQDGDGVSSSAAVSRQDGDGVSSPAAVSRQDGDGASPSAAVSRQDGDGVSSPAAVSRQDGDGVSSPAAVSRQDGDGVSSSAAVSRQDGDGVRKETPDVIKAITELYTAAADGYDDITNMSRPLIAKEKEEAEKARLAALAREREEAQKALNEAMARAEKSRQQAMNVEGQTYFPNEWKSAEAQNTSGKSAKKTTPEEIKAATALFIAAANAYDVIAKNSGPRFAKDKDDATKALNAAVARAEKSRKAASDASGQSNFPNDWRSAEAKNQSANNAKKTTVAEIKAATALYITAADAYDDIAKKSNDTAAVAARTRAEKERQAALDALANIALKDDFDKAETLYQQAQKDFNSKLFPTAADRYSQAATQFTAVAKAAAAKRTQADDIIKKAAARSDQSIALATNAGEALEGRYE